MRKLPFFLAATVLFPFAMMAQDFEDDIYYDGRKAEKQQAARQAQASQQNPYAYGWQPSIETERDVDEYNRFGGYYGTAADTIGYNIANSEDFVYTQKIQKFYNPTIVVDNQDVLADVLNNSYGNVNVIYNPWGPAFDSWAYMPYTQAWGYPWYGLSVGGSWYRWDSPWYASWSPWFYPWYDYGWNWGWGPSWNWGWGYPCHGWHHHHSWAYGDYHRRPSMGVRPGWSAGARPSRPSSAGMASSRRPGAANTTPRPGYMGGGTLARPGNSGVGSGRPGYQRGDNLQHRPPTGTVRPGNSSARPGTAPTRTGYTYDYRKNMMTGAYSKDNAHDRDNGGYVNGAGSNNRVLRGGTVGTSRPGTSTGTYNGMKGGGRTTQGYRSGGSTTSRPATTTTRPSNSSYQRTTTRSSGSFNSSRGSSRSSGSFRSGGGGGGRASGGRR